MGCINSKQTKQYAPKKEDPPMPQMTKSKLKPSNKVHCATTKSSSAQSTLSIRNINGNININDNLYKGSCVSIVDHVVYIDGEKVNISNETINVKIHGNVEYIKTMSGQIIVNGNSTNIESISGGIKVSGNCNYAQSVSGSIMTGKCKQAGSVSGSIMNL